jgi:alpha-tubulin suppressor-like RCC1 family protein
MRFTKAFTTTIAIAGVAGGLCIAQPAAAATASPVVALAAGDDHTCALHADGAVQCWGGNDFGQLGNPEVESSTRPVPAYLPGDAHAVAIDAGAFHTCVLTRDHRVYCWGYNGWGSLGDGTFTSSSIPAPVTLAPTAAVASNITAGGFTTCVSLSNGTAQCWGRNQYGEVGDSTRTMRNTPTPVTGIADAVDIDAGVNHVCALRSVGRAQCWGRAGDGRTGDATFADVAQVSAGGAHTCMRTTIGALRCWGSNTFGQLTPNNIDADIVGVSTGGAHTCVTTEAGTVRCWGDGSAGQLGVSNVVVEGLDVVETTAGARHTCALLDDASVWCWGDSVMGQAGDHSLTLATTPVNLIAGVPTPPSQPETPAPSEPAPAEPTPVDAEPAPAPVQPAPSVEVPAETPTRNEPAAPQPVEKQVASETPTVVPPNVMPPAPSPITPSPIAKRGVLELRLGRDASLVRVARAAGVRLPGTLIAGSLSRARSVSAHPFNRLRVEMKVSHPRNCRNVLTPVLGAAVRATRVGECRVTLRVSRAGRPDIVRTVIVQTVATVAPVNNLARNTR